MPDEGCEHISAVKTLKHAKKHECEECVKIGGTWVHLRTCQTCGSTLCCDNSPNRHATKHFRGTAHPVIASAEPGERWLYCYPDDAFAEYDRALFGELEHRALRLQLRAQRRDVDVLDRALARRSPASPPRPAAWPRIMYCGSIRSVE